MCHLCRVISESVLNEEAWATCRALAIGPAVFAVECNMPYVEKAGFMNEFLPVACCSCTLLIFMQVMLSARPMAGFPQLPRCETLFSDAQLTRWAWQRFKPGAVWSHAMAASYGNAHVLACAGFTGSEAWEPLHAVAAGGIYTPTSDDEGYMLRAQCTPARAANLGVRLGEAAEASTGMWHSAT